MEWNRQGNSRIRILFNYLIHRIFSQSRFTGLGNHLPACKFPLMWFCLCRMALFKLFQINSQTQSETIPGTKICKIWNICYLRWVCTRYINSNQATHDTWDFSYKGTNPPQNHIENESDFTKVLTFLLFFSLQEWVQSSDVVDSPYVIPYCP